MKCSVILLSLLGLTLAACSPRPERIAAAVAATLTAQVPTSVLPEDRPTGTPVPTVLPPTAVYPTPTVAETAQRALLATAEATAPAGSDGPAGITPAATGTLPVEETPATGPSATPAETATQTVPRVDDRGRLLFEEPFDISGPWAVGETDAAQVEIAEGVMRYTQKSTNSFSFRLIGRQADDFYAQVAAQVDGRCLTGDKYGLIFRLQDSNNYYAFLVDCERQYRVLQTIGGQIHSLIDWTFDDKIDGGTNAANVLAVRAEGNRLQFFVNNEYVAGAQDASFTGGRFGMWVGANATPNFTVIFDDLQIFALSNAES